MDNVSEEEKRIYQQCHEVQQQSTMPVTREKDSDTVAADLMQSNLSASAK
jgi:hypothetical protein